ncbi:hypothetical protein CRUP_031098 [Coryphaenoides rupestris]|nr:hypothetical protein CRUP_031098 [Coryphaenoides rupestris]
MASLDDGDAAASATMGCDLPVLPVFDGVKLAALATVLYVIVRGLNLKSSPAAPQVTYQDTPLNRFLFKYCQMLTQEYIPPLLWGKSGHIQTVLYSKMGRVATPKPRGVRHFLPMEDGATVTFDLFEALGHYIRTFVDHSQRGGYRCAVLNHLGALPDIELTSPRMFTYGCTWEFAAMVSYVKRELPQTLMVVVGFSLGGNIVCKFLGENLANQDRVLCCVSVCQGYSVLRAQETFVQWDQCRRLYNFLLACNMKKVILAHRDSLFGAKSSRLDNEDLNRLHAATSLMQIDDTIMRKFHNYHSLKEYYEAESCVQYIHNITVPLLLVNSSDDPLVHQSLLAIPRTLADKKANVLFVLTQHGGHLGFFEGAVLFPQPLTWIDKLVVSYADTMCQWGRQKHSTPPC